MYPDRDTLRWTWSMTRKRDQWPGKGHDQNVTKAGGVMFWSSLLCDSWKCVTSSSKVLETQWNSLRLKPVLSTFHSKNEVSKHLEQKDFENAWKVSRFFAFFNDVFVVHLQCLEEIKLSAVVNANLFVRLLNLFILWMYNKALTCNVCSIRKQFCFPSSHDVWKQN